MKLSQICDYKDKLLDAGLQVSAPRLAIAGYVLSTDSHPTAEEVKVEVEKFFPTVSVATVYNTLNLFVEKGLLKTLRDPDSEAVRYDCNTSAHHHFIDEKSGRIMDVMLDTKDFPLKSNALGDEYEVSSVEVVFKGRFKGSKKGK